MSDLRDTSSWIIPRIVAGLIACVSLFVLLLIIRSQWRTGFDWFVGGILGSFVTTIATFGWWFALKGQHAKSRKAMAYPLLGGLIIGGVGLIGGFFGPMVFMPNSNLGPLMAIGTAPAGFVAGTVLGAIVAVDRAQQQ